MRYTLLLILSFVAGLVYSSGTLPIKNLFSVNPEKTYTETKAIPASNLKDDFALITSKGYLTASQDKYPVQLGAFRIKSNADALYEKVRAHLDNDAKVIYEDGLYKVRITRVAEHIKTVKPNHTKQILPVTKVTLQSPDSAKYTNKVQSSSPSSPAIVKHDSLNSAIFATDTTLKTGSASMAVHKIFFFKGDSPWLQRINYFGKSLTFVNALIGTIIVSIASMIILLVIILLNRGRMERQDKLHQFLMEKYQALIVDYLFGNTGPEEFHSIASDTYRRQVLIDQMIDVSINLKGEEGRKLISLYKDLNLDKDSIRRAYDRRWHKKIKGFRELAFMNIKDANDVIYKALNSSNDMLRMEAQIALVRLSDDNPFEFLSHLTSPFSLWEQITLHDLIIQHNIAVPSFQKWLGSTNPTVVMFSLRMIREFKQTESEEKVKEILMHRNLTVRNLAVQVAGDLNMRSTLETMKSMYKNQEYNICLQIVKSMGKMPDPQMMGFLKLVLDKEDDVQLQIEATKAIENNGEEGVKALVKIMESEYKNYNIIVKHVLDRRIY